MTNIFTDKIKNTRFILTMAMMGALLIIAGGIYALLFINVDVESKAIAFGVIATIAGSFMNGFGQACSSFFSDKKDQDIVNADIAMMKAENE